MFIKLSPSGWKFSSLVIMESREKIMTKIALLSDIHGNTTALEAVLEDSRKAKVDEYWPWEIV